MQNNKILTLNTAYKKSFKFRFFPDSQQKLLLEQIFGSVRFVYNKTLDYSIKHYAIRQTKFTNDFGDLIIIQNEEFKSLSSTDRINYIQNLKINLTTFNGQLYSDNKEVFNTFNLPSLSKLFDRIEFIQRKIKGSNNRNKTRIKLAKLHAKKENIVKVFYHKLSSRIVNENQVVID